MSTFVLLAVLPQLILNQPAAAPVMQAKQAQVLLAQNSNASELLQSGWQLYQTAKFSEAVKVLERAAEAFKTQKDTLNQARALNYLSLAYQELGQWDEANKAIAHSITLLQTNKLDSQDYLLVLAQAFNARGQLQQSLGQSETAIATWQQATAAYTKIGDTAGIIGSQINTAQALQALGQYRRALIALTQANQTLQQQPDSLLKATGLLSLGNGLRVVGDLDKQTPNVTEINTLGARQILEQAKTVAQKVQSPETVAQIQLSLGNTAQAQQKPEAALEAYREAARQATSPLTQIQAQLNQLHLLIEQGKLSDAENLSPQIQSQLANLPPSRKSVYARVNFANSLTRLREKNPSSNSPAITEIARILATAVQQAKTLQDARSLSYANGTLGKLYEQTGQWSAAQNLTQQALVLAEGIKAGDIAYRWQWQLGRILKASGNLQGSTKEAIASYTKSVDTLKSLRNDLAAINPDVQFSFRESVEPVYRELVELLLQQQGNVEPSQSNLRLARSTIESLQLAELDNFLREACLQAKPQQIDQIDATAAVIYPIILKNRLEVILSLPGKPLQHYATNVSDSEVDEKLKQLQRYLKQPDRTKDVKELSQQVYSWLIEPFADDLEINVPLEKSKLKTLVFVLDGSLRNIPMAVLYDNQRNQYLVQRYAIALTPGLQLIDPKPLVRGQISALVVGAQDAPSFKNEKLNILDNVDTELNQVRQEVNSSRELKDKNFTSTNIQSQLNSTPFSIVHIATHGNFSSNRDKTYILDWNGRIKVNDLDNLLRQRKQRDSKPIELLILSACKTADGDKRAALGLAGIAVRAGARSTLASLWSVNDASTSELMIQFYQQLKDPTVTKAEAMRRAQIAVLNNSVYKAPYYWAPFVMVGNWF